MNRAVDGGGLLLRQASLRRGLLIAPPTAIALALALGACSRRAIQGQAVPRGATVLALGDSLTYGTGAAPDTAYPAVLARLTGWRVVNAGVPGDTAAQVLERTPGLLAEHRPALVLLCAGGNDLLRRQDETALRMSLSRTIERVRDAHAQVLLIAVPRPSVLGRFTGSLDDHRLYGELAEALRVPLHRQGLAEVLSEPALRSDEIHANAAGYERFARGLLATLRAVGLFVG